MDTCTVVFSLGANGHIWCEEEPDGRVQVEIGYSPHVAIFFDSAADAQRLIDVLGNALSGKVRQGMGIREMERHAFTVETEHETTDNS